MWPRQKSLGRAVLILYAKAASIFLPIGTENQPALVADFEADPFVEHALSSAASELYHRYGMFLALLTTAMTTVNHCQFEQRQSQVINNGGEPNDGDYERAESETNDSGDS